MCRKGGQGSFYRFFYSIDYIEKIVNELTKLLKVVDGEKKIAENAIKKIKTSLKL